MKTPRKKSVRQKHVSSLRPSGWKTYAYDLLAGKLYAYDLLAGKLLGFFSGQKVVSVFVFNNNHL
jgi:hypothetical protein